ncbi:hypothetical protein P692DRAFT_20882178 [Suillus brevipes Sb2]|nr:hypothetical protein P692DRAFT_20882178 [Suillus brevipes Sb2]
MLSFTKDRLRCCKERTRSQIFYLEERTTLLDLSVLSLQERTRSWIFHFHFEERTRSSKYLFSFTRIVHDPGSSVLSLGQMIPLLTLLSIVDFAQCSLSHHSLRALAVFTSNILFDFPSPFTVRFVLTPFARSSLTHDGFYPSSGSTTSPAIAHAV